jgi:hypothetical protein
MIIQQPNPDTQVLPKTFLSVACGTATSLPVKNINSFTASWAIQIGETGEEQAEVQVLGTAVPSGTALGIVGTTSYSHPVDTPIYPVKFNQVIFKRSTTGTAGTATAITAGTVNIQADNAFTQFDDTSGATTYAYKTAYYNSVLDVVSDDSSWILPAGNSQYSLSRLRQRIRDKLFNSAFVTDDTLNDWINEWKDELTNTAIKVNKAYAIGTTTVSFAANVQLGTITASDFKTINRIWFSDSSGTGSTNALQTNMHDYSPTDIFSSDRPKFFYYGDTVIGRLPYDYATTATITYSKLNTNLNNDSDELPTPMKGYTKSFIDYAMAQAYMKDNNQEAAKPYMITAENDRLKFQNEITPRHETGPQFVTTVEPISDNEGYYYL